ncbi:MAG: hypothetical protein AB2669_15655 [Candidatus Thiodiazotropha endolucinida]|nr:hypothetical protein [Candidatus Thiodiazotropha taylori]MCW4263494.1 hypothetical protein [Candidatus Thiodiazotropha endolucinida]MCG8032382.1 hypothetical protein [Candidatus Thiodiazotropha taylori]MCG8077294.1 hypothetical protein [Candidatus Thiodiazotropha taylori]MCG8116724.1 hypothetical protein [Candidatus Thiodiazotropha taylori]
MNNTSEVIIKSSSSSASLKFYDRNGEDVTIAYESPAVTAVEKRAWVPENEAYSLINIFSSHIKHINEQFSETREEHPSKNRERYSEWAPLDAPELSITTDTLTGHTTLAIEFASYNDGNDKEKDWRACAHLHINTLELKKVVSDLKKLFGLLEETLFNDLAALDE